MAVFRTFLDQIAAAKDERSRRELLTEIGRWRVGRIDDAAAMRDASYALSCLYVDLGELDAARKEAAQLMALCGMPPAAGKEERRVAERHQAKLERKATPRTEARGGAVSDAADLGAKGDWESARRALRGKSGVKAALARVWAELGAALEAPEPLDAIRALHSSLAPDVDPRGRTSDAKKVEDRRGADRAPAAPSDDPLEQAVGMSLPRTRRRLLGVLHDYVEANPEQVDVVAAAALRSHVQQRGPQAPAPWFATFVAHALAGEGATATPAALADLADSFATTAYDEPSFQEAVALLRAGRAAGLVPGAVRRGVLSKAPAGAVRPWTVRLARADGEWIVGLFPDVSLDEATSAAMVRRLAELAPRAVVVAGAPSQVALRAAAAAIGAAVVDAPGPDAVVSVILAAPEAPKPAPSEPKAADLATKPAHESGAAAAPSDTNDRRNASGRERAPHARSDSPREPSPFPRLAELASAPEPATVEAWSEAIAPVRLKGRALGPVRGPIQDREAPDGDAHFAPFLRAMLGAVDGWLPPEVITFAVRVAADAPQGAVAEVLIEAESAGRLGPSGARVLVDAAAAARQAGFGIGKVLIGITGRERRENPALDALADASRGWWRLLLSGPARAELWWIPSTTPELRSAIALLLGEGAPAAALLSDEADLAQWWATLPGAPASIAAADGFGAAAQAALAATLPS